MIEYYITTTRDACCAIVIADTILLWGEVTKLNYFNDTNTVREKTLHYL